MFSYGQKCDHLQQFLNSNEDLTTSWCFISQVQNAFILHLPSKKINNFKAPSRRATANGLCINNCQEKPFQLRVLSPDPAGSEIILQQ